MKKLLNKDKFLVISCVLILPIFIYRIWFLNFDILTSGDWGFFFKESQLTFFSLPYVWIENSFGSVFLSASSYLSLLFTGILGFINNFPISERLVYFWPSVIFSSIGSYILVKKILNSRLAAVVGSFAFCYNTYFIILQGNGHLTLMASFAIAPLVIYFFIRTLEEKRLALGIITSLFATVSAAYDFRTFYITAFVLLFYFIYYSFLISRFSLKSFFKNSKLALLPMALLFLFNFYWIFGLSQIGSITSNAIFNRSLFGNSFMNILSSITLFHPFWTGTKFESFIVQPIPLYFFLIPIFSFLGLILNKKNKNILFFGFVSLLGIFLTKQVGEPFPNAYQWLYDHFPGFNAFREASKFYFLIALGYSVLIGSFIDWLWRNVNKNQWQNITKYGLTFLIAGLFLWNTKPVITGELGTLFVPRHIPNDYLILENFILGHNEFFRTFWTPRDSRWGIYTNQRPRISNVAVVGSDWKNLLETYNKNEKIIQNRILNVFEFPSANNLLDISSIKYVIVPLQDKANDDDFFIYYGGEDNPNIRDWYISELDKIKFLKKIDIGTKELVVYENENFRPHIYTTSQKETIQRGVPYEKVDFIQKNPTEYKISLKNVGNNYFYLNFSESFHPDWKLRVGDFNWLKAITDKNYFLPDGFHIKNDANLSSFKIDPEYIKKNYPDAVSENPDGTINIDLALYFKPQSYFYLGLIISGTTLLACLGYLGYDFIRRRRIKNVTERDRPKGSL